MKLILVAVKDNAVQAFQAPFSVRAEGEAIRNFQDAVNNPNNNIQKHADDYDLYVIGTFDDENGRIEVQEPKQIARGKNMLMQGGITITAKQ